MIRKLEIVLLCYMVIRGLLIEFVDIIGIIDRN